MPALKTLYGDQPVSHELVKGVTRIGRALESEIRIALRVVSKLHATVTYNDSGCLLEKSVTGLAAAVEVKEVV